MKVDVLISEIATLVKNSTVVVVSFYATNA